MIKTSIHISAAIIVGLLIFLAGHKIDDSLERGRARKADCVRRGGVDVKLFEGPRFCIDPLAFKKGNIEAKAKAFRSSELEACVLAGGQRVYYATEHFCLSIDVIREMTIR